MDVFGFFCSLIGLALYLWLCYYLAEQFYEAAKAKGYSDKKYFWITFWLGPIGYWLIIALPDRGAPAAVPTTDAENPVISNAPLYDELPEL